MKKIALIIMMVLLWEDTKAVICNSTCSGNWESPSTWSCGVVPSCGDTICIMAGNTVTVSTVNSTLSSGSPVCIYVYGTLNFNTGKQLSLACNSMVCLMAGSPNGELTAGNGGGASNQLTICNTLVWQAGNGDQEGPKIFKVTTLPVELLSFDAVNVKGRIQIKWATASEIDNNYFEILRSENGEQFKMIGHVDGSGTTNQLTNYSFLDENPIEGLSYYRLKQVDFNGNKELHPITSVSVNVSSDLNLYPNPFLDRFEISGIDEDQMKLSLFNVMGSLIEIRLVNSKSLIDYNHLSKGSYFVQLESTTSNKVILRKVLMKQ